MNEHFTVLIEEDRRTIEVFVPLRRGYDGKLHIRLDESVAVDAITKQEIFGRQLSKEELVRFLNSLQT